MVYVVYVPGKAILQLETAAEGFPHSLPIDRIQHPRDEGSEHQQSQPLTLHSRRDLQLKL